MLKLGCKKTTLNEIIAQSGVSNGGLYHYFKSKDEIFGVIMKQRMDEINERFYREADLSLVGPTSIIVNELFGNHDNCKIFRSIFLYLVSQPENPRTQKIISELHDYWLELGSSWISLGQKDGLIDPSLEPKQTASYIVSYYFGLLINSAYVADESLFKPEAIIPFVTRFLRA
ncbi:putative HTH-type transcriptional regulator YfiR [compost metagenome]